LIARVTLLRIRSLRFYLWAIVPLHFPPNWPSGRCGIAVTHAHRISVFPVDCSDRSGAMRWITSATPARLP